MLGGPRWSLGEVEDSGPLAGWLVTQGCNVLLTCRSGTAAAERLRSEFAEAAGEIEIVQKDAGDADGWRRIRARLLDRFGGLDILVCNAFPPPRPAGFNFDSAGRQLEFLGRSLPLVSLPLASCLELLEARKGSAVLISSHVCSTSAVDITLDWHSYEVAKHAAEGLVRSLAAQAVHTHFLIARPPRLLTEMTNTVVGREGSIRSEVVAAAIVRLLSDLAGRDRLTILDQFSSRSTSGD